VNSKSDLSRILARSDPISAESLVPSFEITTFENLLDKRPDELIQVTRYNKLEKKVEEKIQTCAEVICKAASM
jgi:hypothetical protein